MSGEILKVNPDVLNSATTAFGDAVDALNRIHADLPVGDAAAAVSGLLTAESCRKAQAGIAAAVTVAVENVRKYGQDLDAAARAYSGQDKAGAGDISDVSIPT